MTRIVINDVDFQVDEFEKYSVPETGQKEVSFIFDVVGISNYNLYSSFFKANEYKVVVPHINLTFNATLPINSVSYKGELDEETPVRFNIALREKRNVDEDEEPNILANIGQEVINSRIRFRSLIEILEEKGIFIRDEYEAKVKEVAERDFEEIKNELVYGPEEENE